MIHPKDKVLLALALALCAMGTLVSSLIYGLFAQAIFAGVVMLIAAGIVVRFIGIVELPMALRRRGLGG
ncbi:MAG TPA: hypothetical protein PLH21_02505 [Chiayiivirga sp.]|nr:hypothetical protein [Chiayiivirga sp.]